MDENDKRCARLRESKEGLDQRWGRFLRVRMVVLVTSGLIMLVSMALDALADMYVHAMGASKESESGKIT